MADLDPLIRLRKYGVEEKQKILADLFRAAEALESRKADLLAQVAAERQLAEDRGAEFETLAAFTLYMGRVRQVVELIDAEIAKLDRRIEKAQEDMREAFGEMKKIEIIQHRREEAERAEENRREGKVLDEVGIEGFRRREDEK
jgi:flagellar FliJ protein